MLPNPRIRLNGLRLVVLLVTTTIAGCGSLSDSSISISRSVSNSISSSFESSSRSSSPGEAYQSDVRDFTASYIKSGGDPSSLKSEVGSLARKNGVTDWEHNENTYRGIGAGLAKAGLTEAELEAYKRTIATNDQQAQWMQSGYDSEN
jgi:hypothetical protein